MVRTPSFDKRGMKKGSWTPEEDRKLVAYITRYGCWNWRQIPRFAGLARCGKSCRLRWMNYLKPDIKRGDYTQEEEDTIVRLHHKLGSKWSVIAGNLPGRTDNDIKNHWHSSLKKRFQRNAKALGGENDEDSSSKQAQVVPQTPDTDSGPVTSPQLSSTELSNITPTTQHSHENNNLVIDDDLDFLDAYITQMANENNWSEAFLAENNGNGNSDTAQIPVDSWALSPQSSSGECFVNGESDEHFAFVEPTVATQLTGVGDFWGEQCVATDMSHVPDELFAPFLYESHDFLCPDVNLWS